MSDFKPGDRVTYEDYGITRRATVTGIGPNSGRVVYLRQLDGPLAGGKAWKHAESLTKEAAPVNV
jgi:hypothetical protein